LVILAGLLVTASRSADPNFRAVIALAVMARDVYVTFSAILARLHGFVPEENTWTYSTMALVHLCAEAMAFMGVAALEMLRSDMKPTQSYRI